MKTKKLSLREKITADVDDELYKIKKMIQKKYSLTWIEARNETNKAIKLLMCVK